jgi:hypothetical protein
MVSENNFFRQPELKLYFRDLKDPQRKKRGFVLRSWATVKDAKDAIQRLIQIPPHAQRLYYGPLQELPNHRTLHDAGIYRSGATLLLDIKGKVDTSLGSIDSLHSSGSDVCISSSMLDSTPSQLRQLVQLARRGIAVGIKPALVMDGSGGTYFLHDSKKAKVAVFKPADEEPYAENNPRGYLPQAGANLALREGIAPGEGCIREVAAFLLDHDGFAGVPMTTLVEVRHPTFNINGSHLKVVEGGASMGAHSIAPNSPTKTVCPKKVGSFQEFAYCDYSMDDLSPSKLSVDDVHKIAILDIRILNADRNAANLLCRRTSDNRLELVPIDHSFCLRSSCDVSWMDWCWLDWAQTKEPLSEKTKEYVRKLDIDADALLLKERLNICDEAIDYFRASSLILKAGVEAGLSLYQIAVMCCRNDNLAQEPSLLERLTALAAELAEQCVDNDNWHHTTASRAVVDQLTPKRGSYMTSAGFKGRFHRSASSGEFRSLSSRDSILSDTKLGGSPPMAQSSGSSDSGNDSFVDGTADQDDVTEWAHYMLEDSFVHVVPTRRNQRSSSIASDDASNDSCGSPRGFWHVRPGTPPDVMSDDGSVSWSPVISHHTTIELGQEVPPLGIEFQPLERRRSVQFSEAVEPVLRDHHNSSGEFLLPPAVIEAPFNQATKVSFNRQESSDSSGMRRCKSYTAFSRTGSMDEEQPKLVQSAGPSNVPNKRRSVEDQENMRLYFHKFTSLAIDRELRRVVTENSEK